MTEQSENFNKIRRPSAPAQVAVGRQNTTSSFTGMDEDFPQLRVEEPTSPHMEFGATSENYKAAADKALGALEFERKRRKKLEMLLEVYDIPLPPWKDR